MNSQQVLGKIGSGTFRGYAMPHHPDVEIELSPQKLVIRIPGQTNREIFYDEDYNPIVLKEGVTERKNLLNDSFAKGQYLFRDPRFCLRVAKNFVELGADACSMVIWEEKVPFLGKFRREAEIKILDDNKFIMTSKRFRNEKEVKSQRAITEFSA